MHPHGLSGQQKSGPRGNQYPHRQQITQWYIARQNAPFSGAKHSGTARFHSLSATPPPHPLFSLRLQTATSQLAGFRKNAQEYTYLDSGCAPVDPSH